MAEVREKEKREKEFDGLLMPLLGKAYGMCFHMLGNREEAEDLVQVASVLAFRAFGSYQSGTNFNAWFFKILINCVRQHCRKKKREPEIAPIDDAPDLYFYAQVASAGMLAKHSNPAALVISKMTEEQIRAAISALPNEYRMVSVLYFVEELAYQEIADLLDCPVGTVRSRLHRGRRLLQKALWQVAQEYAVVNSISMEKVTQS